MKSLLWAACLSLSLTGCYTMLYPPQEEALNGDNPNGVLVIPDSLAGRGVTIINQNQIILDRYYEDPFYRRDGFFGGSGCWDPYYYDYRGYNQRHNWRNGRYYDPGSSSGTSTPTPRKARREKDLRRSEAYPQDEPNQSETSVADAAPAVPTVIPIVAPAASQPDNAKKEVVNANDASRTVRSLQPADSLKSAPPADPPKDQTDDKKARRGNIRGR